MASTHARIAAIARTARHPDSGDTHRADRMGWTGGGTDGLWFMGLVEGLVEEVSGTCQEHRDAGRLGGGDHLIIAH